MSERNDVTAQVPDTPEDMTDGNVQTFTIDEDQAGRADKALCLKWSTAPCLEFIRVNPFVSG